MALTHEAEICCVKQAHAELETLLHTVTLTAAAQPNSTAAGRGPESSGQGGQSWLRPNRVQAASMYRAEVEQQLRAGLTLTQLLLDQVQGT